MLRSSGAKQLAARILGSSFSPYVFSICLIGLTFKQTQVFGGIGPFQVLMAATCMIFTAAAIIANRTIAIRSLLYAAVFVACLLVSSCVALLQDPARFNLREFVAYSFSIVIVYTFLVCSSGGERAYLRAIIYTNTFFLTAFAMLYFSPTPLGDAMHYQGADKLQGLSDNPNQIAFIGGVTVCLTIFLELSNQLDRTRILVVTTLVSYSAALASSTALTFGLVLCCVLSIVFCVVSLASGRGYRIIMSGTLPILIWGAAAFLPSLPSAFDFDFTVPSASPTVQTGVGPAATLIARDPREDAARIALWKNALPIALTSPIAGLGPGVHVPLIFSGNPTTLNEAHSTPLDIFIVFGLLGITALFSVTWQIAYSTYRAKAILRMLIILSPIAVFVLTHFVGRQPLFWILLFLSCSYMPYALRTSAVSETN